MATRKGRTQAYSAGNKTYGGGRPMPTIGPVDKMGYRERDAKGMIWKNALSRRLGMGGQQPGGMQQSSNMGGPPQQDGISDSLRRPINTRTATGQQPSATIGGGAAGQGQSKPTVQIPVVKPLVSSPSGQLAGQANAGLNGLPYDPSYEGVRRAIAAKRDAANAGLNQQRTNMELEAGGQKREIDQQSPEILKQLLEGFAGRGLAYSGKYAMDMGEQQNQFAAAKSRIDQMLAGNRSALDAEMAKFEAGLQSELSDAEYQYARSLAENAGNLGLNLPEQPPVAGGFEPLPQEQPQFEEPGNPEAVPFIAPSIAQPYNNNYAQPTFNPDPAAATVSAPSVGNNIANGPGRNTRPNPAQAPTPAQQYQSPEAPRTAPQPVDLAARPGGTRTMASFDPRSQATLSQGGQITGGNGYVYKFDPNTGQAVRVR